MQNIPGDVHITTVSLFADAGVVNMVEHVQQMVVSESIITPGIMAELTILDSKNLLTELTILGGERFVIEFAAPGRKSVRYDLILTSIKNAIPSDNMRSKMYNIVAASPEVVVNKSVEVSKAYNTNISNIVGDIVKSYLNTKKKLNIQQTRGIQKIIIPSKTPFDAIKMIRKRSSSIEDKSSAYVFFENQEGFHFRTIENLMTQNNVGDRVFTNDETLHSDITLSEFRNIIGYEIPQQFDIINRLKSGGMAQEVKKFDFKSLTYTKATKKFNPSEFKNADGIMNDPDNDILKQNYSKSSGSSTWTAHDSGNPETFISESAGSKSVVTSLYKQGMISLNVFGDSEITAGQVIEAKIVENNAAEKAPEEHRQLSGKYLIGALNHIIGPEGYQPRYTCTIDALKGGYKETRR
jgi:hypothetical protein